MRLFPGERLVLASASPRRVELLRGAGLPVEVVPAHITEDEGTPGADPRALALRNAQAKARAVARSLPGRLVLGADTVVAADAHLLGKPASPADAARMLRTLSGRRHEVVTGVCLARDHVETAWTEVTTVQFAHLDDARIAAYLAAVEVADKAGAYAIQERADLLGAELTGSWSNVVGLPVEAVLARLGVSGQPLVVDLSHDAGTLRRARAACLAAGAVAHQFHYATAEQAAAWLRVHQTHSPAHHDPAVRSLYDEAAAWLAARNPVPGHLASLGSGGGAKDAVLLARLAARASDRVYYTALDAGRALVAESVHTVARHIPGVDARGVVADLERCAALRTLLLGGRDVGHTAFLFLGMVPNFEPRTVVRILRDLLRPGDVCLVSVNLAPAPGPGAVRALLPQYDNPETRAWLTLFPRDAGWRADPAAVRFDLAADPEIPGLHRIEAVLREDDRTLRLFYSYRYTPAQFEALMQRAALPILARWISPTQDEAVYAVTERSAKREA